ncbi:serine hydrolase [Microlunatus soli]|uniref:Beta-lactamase class A n=1 Tax=Microlunatus soli TaxID=630515 RepID=A0A1H1WYB3_9ACTN|nr:serine hydrolase [Microlunatus soli]SDT01952.1 beta-lactamase class A [Microlunatus soli]
MSRNEVLGSTVELMAAAEQIRSHWRTLGIDGALQARNIDTGEEFGFAGRRPFCLASVVKVPIALVAADKIARGSWDGAEPVVLGPEDRSFGRLGLSAYRYPVTIALADLLVQMLSVSDNAAGDAVLDRIGIGNVNRRLRTWGSDAIVLRHRFQQMYDYATRASGDAFGLAAQLAVEGKRSDGSHVIASLDVHRGNVGTAYALVELLTRIWLDTISVPEATATIRDQMGRSAFQHRMSSDLQADDIAVAAKTGTFLTQRHEIGVVSTHGSRIAIAALTESSRPAAVQQDVDLAIGAAARTAVELLRL